MEIGVTPTGVTPEAGNQGPGTTGRHGVFLVILLVLAIRIPFLNQAIQGDDHIYLTEAAHALIDPLHPGNTKYVFLGDEVDLRGHSHPPLNAWVLSGLIVLCGSVKEVPFHAVYILFSLIAAATMWSLAKRFSPHPLWAALLLLAVPAFIVNGNSLEADLPFLAFWMAAVALFCNGRLLPAAVSMAAAAMTAYQAVLLTPVLAAYLWTRDRSLTRGGQAVAAPKEWLSVLTPPAVIALWQLFERATTGATPAAVLSVYLTNYETLQAKFVNALALAIHSWFLIFPLLAPPAFVLAWRKRREPDTRFLVAWIGIFFAGALAIFFAGSARYLLPMAAPVALLASRLRPRWLAIGFAAQLVLGLGLAAVNYRHWDGYRQSALSRRDAVRSHRFWVDGEWGLRFYLEREGALPLRKTQPVRPGDTVVSSELGHSVDVNAPVSAITTSEIRPGIPLRLIGLESHSGYSTASRGFWPFGMSRGVIDRVRVLRVLERHPTLEYLPMNAPEAPAQIVSGIYALDNGRFRWMAKHAAIALKNPAALMRVAAAFYIPPQARAREVAVLVDGRAVASGSYARDGSYTLYSRQAVRGSGDSVTLEIVVDQTFTAPPDARELGIVLTGAGFVR